MQKILTSGLFLLFVLSAGRAQVGDLTKDIVFFKQQQVLYQRWLDHSGLGQYLRVEDMEVKEQELSLYLSMPFSSLDSIISAWTVLKADFEQEASISLEQQLFYKAVN